MRALTTVLALSLAIPGAVSGFSGNGRALYREAQIYLSPSSARGGQGESIRSMGIIDRLEKAAGLLKGAQGQATSPREEEALGKLLGRAYNQMGVEYHKQKDFSNAIWAEEQAIEYRGDTSAVFQMNLGAMYSDSGDYYNAARALERARELGGPPQFKDRIINNLVGAYIRDGQTRDPGSYQLATRVLEDELYNRGEDFNLLVMLGRTYRLEGEPQRALEAWDRARALKAFDPGMRKAYVGLQSSIAVKRDFVTTEARHFKIEFNDQTHGHLADKFLEMFEEAYDEVGLKFDAQWEGMEQVTISVYASTEFQSAVQIAWAGGVHQANRISLKVNPSWSDPIYRNLIFHEYAHHIVDFKAGGKSLPAWVQEGLAMHQEPKLAAKGFYKALGNAAVRNTLLPLSDLNGSFSRLPAEKVMLAYGQSYDFVRFLLGSNPVSSFVRLLTLRGQGVPISQAFEQSFSMSLADAEEAWRAWLGDRIAKSRARRVRQRTERQSAGQQRDGDEPTTRDIRQR